jgi:hypothetical protein
MCVRARHLEGDLGGELVRHRLEHRLAPKGDLHLALSLRVLPARGRGRVGYMRAQRFRESGRDDRHNTSLYHVTDR